MTATKGNKAVGEALCYPVPLFGQRRRFSASKDKIRKFTQLYLPPSRYLWQGDKEGDIRGPSDGEGGEVTKQNELMQRVAGGRLLT